MHQFFIDMSYYINFIFDWTVLGGIAVLMILCLIAQKEFEHIKIFMIALITTIVVTIVLKNIFQVDRPVEALIDLDDYAFPSGHAAISFFFLTFMTNYVLLAQRHTTWKIISISIFTITALAISTSRVILLVHTIDQVVVGSLLGICVTTWVILKVSPKHNFLVD